MRDFEAWQKQQQQQGPQQGPGADQGEYRDFGDYQSARNYQQQMAQARCLPPPHIARATRPTPHSHPLLSSATLSSPAAYTSPRARGAGAAPDQPGRPPRRRRAARPREPRQARRQARHDPAGVLRLRAAGDSGLRVLKRPRGGHHHKTGHLLSRSARSMTLSMTRAGRLSRVGGAAALEFGPTCFFLCPRVPRQRLTHAARDGPITHQPMGTSTRVRRFHTSRFLFLRLLLLFSL